MFKLINIVLLFISLSIYSQEVFIGEFENTPATFKSTNERIGNKTFVQLKMKVDNTYIIESYVYNKYDDIKVYFNCTNQNGTWFKENNVITFSPNSVNRNQTKEFRYRLVNNKKLFYIGYGKKYAKKTKLIKTKTFTIIRCDSLPKSVEPEW
ncbi:hypothetical protein ABW636_09560 [Aquimarina sp. 2201CG1-2-11]|uniref:hypothetical protein n=1 Tax=Aquimarina discodermiae TaxID=3231043 RepID=UPI0034625E6D